MFGGGLVEEDSTEKAEIVTDPYLQILHETDVLMKTLEAITPKERRRCQMLMTEFGAESFAEAFSSFAGIQKEVTLMVLQQVLPRLSEDFKDVSRLPLEKFRSNFKIANYLDAVIKSGVAADIDHGIVFLVGNTGVGKTSLANTLKAYIEHPSDNPSSILAGTGQYKDLIETQVLEVYNEVPFQQEQDQTVRLTNTEAGPTLVDFVHEADTEETLGSMKSIKIRLVDLGGHQEYYACSSLFFSTSGLFLICFHSELLLHIKDSVDDYYGSVGTFVDLVSQTSAKSGLS